MCVREVRFLLAATFAFRPLERQKGTRIKTFQSGLFRPTVPGVMGGVVRLAPSEKLEGHRGKRELERLRRPGKTVHRKLGLGPSNFAYQKCLDRRRIEGSDASHPNTNNPPQKTPLSARGKCDRSDCGSWRYVQVRSRSLE